MLRLREFRPNLVVNLHGHDGMSSKQHYGLNPMPNVKDFSNIQYLPCVQRARKISKSANVKYSSKYEHFGETIWYLTLDELQQFFDSIDNYSHRLIFRVIYEIGCRVWEFVRIQVKHLNFSRSTVFFPTENTKTKYPRISCLPKGLMNEVRSMLKQKGMIK